VHVRSALKCEAIGDVRQLRPPVAQTRQVLAQRLENLGLDLLFRVEICNVEREFFVPQRREGELLGGDLPRSNLDQPRAVNAQLPWIERLKGARVQLELPALAVLTRRMDVPQ
jgi:hypothetical protein